MLFILLTILVYFGLYQIEITTATWTIYGATVNNDHIPLSVLVYSTFMFVFLVYATGIYTKHCITFVPKIFVDMQVAHMANKLSNWFTVYRLGPLSLFFKFLLYLVLNYLT